MRRDQPVRASLRAATAGAHERVDAVYGTFDLSDAKGYAAFLEAQAAALLPLEQALDAGAAGDLPLDWAERRRSPKLLADLRTLDRDVPASDPLPPIVEPAAALGTLYVLEGSRLGGALLKRSVPPGFPTAFLAPAPPAMWRKFLEVLEDYLTTADLRASALAAAERAFALFEASGRARSAAA